MFLHQATTNLRRRLQYNCCLSSCSYIKPQHDHRQSLSQRVVYHLVPTSSHNDWLEKVKVSSVVYHLVPTSSHNLLAYNRIYQDVVYHLVPTSSHNSVQNGVFGTSVVYHLVPTSSHNFATGNSSVTLLFIILFLHQATTRFLFFKAVRLLFIILFLHQATTMDWITPAIGALFIILFLHQATTVEYYQGNLCMLFIILFLHQATTRQRCSPLSVSCLSSCSYIKPQLSEQTHFFREVVYHLVPTSSHNFVNVHQLPVKLFIILFLHQATTQPLQDRHLHRCLSSYSYIKPQRLVPADASGYVVYHLVPTSSHNCSLRAV